MTCIKKIDTLAMSIIKRDLTPPVLAWVYFYAPINLESTIDERGKATENTESRKTDTNKAM